MKNFLLDCDLLAILDCAPPSTESLLRLEKDKMIVCPHCGSSDYDTFDSVHGDDNYIDLCVCFDCDKQFEIIYSFKEVKKVD